MKISSPSVTLTSSELKIGDGLTVQHLALECSDLSVVVPLGSGPARAHVSARVVINEAELNRLIGAVEEGSIRDMSVGLMTGKVRITGRYEVVRVLAVPFALVAVPEIVGGTHVRLDVQDVSLIGAALPGFSSQMIGERLNARLSDVLNVQRLGVPLRLLEITVEPGRLVLRGDATLALYGPHDSATALTRPA